MISYSQAKISVDFKTLKWTQFLLVCIVVFGLTSTVQMVSAGKTDDSACIVMDEDVYDFVDAIEDYVEGCEMINFVNITEPIEFEKKIDIIGKSIMFNTTEGNSTVLAYCPPKKKDKAPADYFFYINDATYVSFENINITTCGHTDNPYFYVKETLLEITNCNITDNVASVDAGAILCEEADIAIYNSSFIYNVGIEGGVVELQSNCTFIANGTDFISNTADKGSVAYISECGNLIDFVDCTFMDNVGKDTQDYVFVEYETGYITKDIECPNEIIYS